MEIQIPKPALFSVVRKISALPRNFLALMPSVYSLLFSFDKKPMPQSGGGFGLGDFLAVLLKTKARHSEMTDSTSKDNGLPTANSSSWRRVLDLLDEFPENETWTQFKKEMRAIIESGISENLDQFFRAGMSMHYFLFSTLPQHGLNGEFHVTLGKTDDGRRFFVGYSQHNLWFQPAIDLETVATSKEAHSVLRKFLLRLWNDTKAGEPAPIALR